MTTERLAMPAGARIDRDAPLRFTFDGRPFTGFAGDTIASALAANGVWLLSRSFKYHRPRGALTLAGQDGNTLVTVNGEPNLPADVIELADGMVVTPQNVTGSLNHDPAAVIQWFSRFLPVGFYYHAFFRPRGIWEWFARGFRRLAGLGVIDPGRVEPARDKRYRHCDVAVIGAGRAGMEAALDAAASGDEVLLIEAEPTPGGALNHRRGSVESGVEREERDRLLTALAACPNIEMLCGTTADGWYADHWLELSSGGQLTKLRAGRVVLAAGTLGQHAVFRNNDLPGIVLGSAAQRLIKLYGVRPGRRAVVLTGNDDGYGVALDLLDAGLGVSCVVELRDAPGSDPRVAEVLARGVGIRPGHGIAEARGRRHVAAVDIRRIEDHGRLAARGEVIDCDLLCVSVGTMPAWQLPCMAGAVLQHDEARAGFVLTGLPVGSTATGSVAATARGTNHPWPIFPHPRGMDFVDFDEDLQVKDIRGAVAAGYEHIQLVKRYSTSGMGPSQGRHSALPAARLVAEATDRSIAETGVTTARPPATAQTLAQNAGRSFLPALRTAMHPAHLAAGAQFMIAGDWYRPAYYGVPEQRSVAIAEEVHAVRHGCGVIDVSTLGGIDLRGPDAAEFMNRIYTFGFVKQAVGTSRYALLCNDAGAVIDDGVACRLGDAHYYVTTTTGGADRVFRTMLHRNAEWGLDVHIANVSQAYCGISVAGPASRDVLATLTDVDLSAEAFPYLGVRSGSVCGARARLLRVGFVGELGYEIHAPQTMGADLWQAILRTGEALGIRPVGIEAQRQLRLEKGHVIIGQDTDATSTPAEIGMGWAVSTRKPWFIGKSSLDLRPAPDRALVGFEIADVNGALPAEGHLLFEAGRMIGRVTSCGVSATLGRIVGLAFVPPDRAEPGTELEIHCDGDVTVLARVTSLPFYDPDNARQQL